MFQPFTCPQGHQWDAPNEAKGLATMACPVCGLSALTRERSARPAGADPPAVTLPPPDATWPPGTRIAGYEILEELGRGGMGVVYKARQLGLNRLVALKAIRAGRDAEPDQRARFRAEAEAVARLKHPHIVQVYEFGEHHGQPFYSLEYVDSGNLGQKTGGTPQPPDQAARLVEIPARAAHATHLHHILHRDLKPANILLAASSDYGLVTTAYGLPKISDFGLAKLLDSDPGRTQPGLALGTPSYMAPEQAAGDRDAIGPATDVYALGAILYTLLYRSATSFSDQDGRHRDRTRTHPVNFGRAVPYHSERSDRNAILPAFL
jgi:serine/threonine protein kinase